VQVDPIKPTSKPPGTKRLKPKFDGPLSNFAFKFNLRRFNLELYGGCKSWVELPFQIPAGAGVATLSDAEFAARGAALRAALTASGVDYAAVDVA
jgi:hypothetical protein